MTSAFARVCLPLHQCSPAARQQRPQFIPHPARDCPLRKCEEAQQPPHQRRAITQCREAKLLLEDMSHAAMRMVLVPEKGLSSSIISGANECRAQERATRCLMSPESQRPALRHALKSTTFQHLLPVHAPQTLLQLSSSATVDDALAWDEQTLSEDVANVSQQCYARKRTTLL